MVARTVERARRRLGLLLSVPPQTGVPLSKFTTLRVGGPAALFAVADSLSDLHAVIETVTYYSLPLLILGRGSNLLVADSGFDGLVLTLGKDFSHIRMDSGAGHLDSGSLDADRRSKSNEALEVVAGAAASLSALTRFAAAQGLAGLSFAVGVPGTVGAAVAVNAGAHGADMASIAKQVTVYTSDCRLVLMEAAQLGFSYRHSELAPGSVVVEARFSLRQGEPRAIAAEMEEHFSRRKETQPLNMPSAGSAFKNPQGASAGQLIEQSGCKGLSIGGARVSPKHANFIVNAGDASADDVYRLLLTVQARVLEQTGVRLEPEWRFAGSFDLEG